MVPIRTAVDGLHSFVLNDVIPLMPNGPKKFGAIFGVCGAKYNPDFLLKPYESVLKMSGILSEDGQSVDEQRLSAVLADTFNQMPALELLGFTFTADDARKVVDRITKGA